MARRLGNEKIKERTLNFECARQHFEDLGGVLVNGFPKIDSPVFHTDGTYGVRSPYKKP